MNDVFDTDILKLLGTLYENDIFIWQEQGKLKYKSKEGKISKDILMQLKDMKLAIISFLQDCENNKFPMSPLQSAYLVGEANNCELGNTNAHYYIEYEISDIDVEKMQTVINELIFKHDVLRMIVLKEGENYILNNLPLYTLSTYQYIDRTSRKRVRNIWKNHVYKIENWPMFHFEVGKSDVRNDVLHISFDCLILDAWSAKKLIDELFQLYNGQKVDIPQFSFKEYMEKAAIYESKTEKKAEDYWKQELEKVSIPSIKTEIPIHEVTSPQFGRVEYIFTFEETKCLYERAKYYKLTPAATICTLFLKTLCEEYGNQSMTLDITLFNRLPLNAEVDKILGEFTNVGLVTFQKSDNICFLDEVIKIQRQFWKLVQYREYDGTKLLKNLAKGKVGKAVLPIVYTCMLDGCSCSEQPLFKEVYALSKTPQVMLDHHVRDDLGSLKLSFDYVTDLFREEDMEKILLAYVKRVKSAMTQIEWDCIVI